MITAPCETDMDDLGLNIEVNNEPREDSETVSFSDIPSDYNPNTVINTTAVPSNSITVDFGKLVELNVLEIDSPGVSDISIIVKDGNGDVLIDADGNPFTDVIKLDDGKLVFPDHFPVVEVITIIIVSSNTPTLTLDTNYLGCLHPSEFTLICYHISQIY